MSGRARTVLILTGATGLVGRAVARRLAGTERTLVLAARRPATLEALVADLGPEARAHPVVCDVTRPPQVEALMDTARTLGTVAQWVHATGLEVAGDLDQGSVEAWREMLEVNLLSAATVGRAFAAACGRRGGTAVWIGSRRSSWASPGDAVYAASKAALSSLAASFRAEPFAARLRLTLLEPAVVAEGRGAVLRPDDVAAAVAWLLDLPRAVEVTLLRLRHPGDRRPRPPRPRA